ncbi:MAG: hypothetical protein MdMp014T_2274 [Treponematales bacterium]
MSADLEEMKQILRETDKIVKENAEAQKKSREEADRQMRELRESQKELAESRKETDRQLRELKAQVSGVSDNIGMGAEEYFQTALAKSLNFAGIQFDDMIPNLAKTRKRKSCEFDIVLVNHDAVALIEAKHRIYKTFPEEMVTEKAAEFRFFFPEYKDYKLYLGAAGFSVDKRAVNEARRLGVGLLKQDGDAVKTVDIPLKAY